MLKIDDRYYSREMVDSALEDLAVWLDAQSFPISRLAVCTGDVFDWLLLVLHCRRRGLSLVPIHAETPAATARERRRCWSWQLLRRLPSDAPPMARPSPRASPSAWRETNRR